MFVSPARFPIRQLSVIPLAEQGYAETQSLLASMYERGRGVQQDYKLAAKWYKLAAEQDYVFAQYNLDSMYADGQGVPQDYILAHMWVNLAASNDYKIGEWLRDKVALKMPPSQIAEAQRMACKWVAKHR